jgi:hypothetical protein
LPTTCPVGARFPIAGGSAAWEITQAAGQQIVSGSSATTEGTDGKLTGSANDSAELVCIVANSKFIVLSKTNGVSFV